MKQKHLNIKGKILLCMTLTVSISLLILGLFSVALNMFSTNSTLEETMQETAVIASERVAKELKAHINVAVETGSVARLANPNTSVEEKRSIINQRAQSHGYQRGNLLDANGLSLLDGNDYSDRDYFQQAIQGRAYVSAPLISKITGELTIIVAAPLWEGGIPDTRIVGVIYFVPPETFLNDIVDSIQISKNGSSYILDKDGYTIAHPNKENVVNHENSIQDAKTDKSLADLAALEQNMTAGASGFGSYTYGGVSKFLAYAPIEGTDGWSIGINAPNSDFMSSTYVGIALTIAILALGILTCFLIALKLANGIGKPMAECTQRLNLLAQGDLKSPVPVVNRSDETGELANATKTITETLSGIITDVTWGLGELSKGDFTVDSRAKELYVGDYMPLAASLYQLIERISTTLSQINVAADQVSAGSSQVSDGAQALAQGSTEQASATEQLAASIHEISGRVRSTAEYARTARQVAGETGDKMVSCNTSMQEMTAAMDEISGSSQEIGKIISTIENIAFQTNILALNAAVEAARAGTAGKGFAVVADEVRSLANKSSQASRETAALIERSINSVQNGTRIANETAQALTEAVEKARSVISDIKLISQSSEEQDVSIGQVTLGVEQISSVVQTNSATSEESAAASEELSSQAQTLKELIHQFKIKDHYAANAQS